MFIVKEITPYGYRTNPNYRVVVDLIGTESWFMERGLREPADQIVFNVFYHLKSGQWRVQVPMIWKILNESLDCVKVKVEEMDKVPYGWLPCKECPNTQCTSQFKAFTYYPKIRLSGGPSRETWILAMNTGAAVAKLINPRYPANTKQSGGLWVGIRKCSDCIHSRFIKRDNDPDCFDAVQGVATRDSSLYHEVERQPSLSDKRELRDTRAKDPYMICSVTDSYVFDEDACTDYIWRALLTRHCDWVPASPSASALSGIKGGVGNFIVEIPDSVAKQMKNPRTSAGGAPF